MDEIAAPLPPLFVTVGENTVRAFGMDAATRAAAMAVKAGLEPAPGPQAGRSTIIASLGWTWDPAWLRTIKASPETVLVKDGAPVMAHVAAAEDTVAAIAALSAGNIPPDLEPIDADSAEVSYGELRKKQRPFVMPLVFWAVDEAERAAYDASYKGVTDALTLYLWRKPAFYLTRAAARAGLTPNQVTVVGAILCVATFFLWLRGWYWTGIASGFVFMVLDTVDGKLARCTGQSSWWGNIFDHGIDLVHPPFWWWAWAAGLAVWGQPVERVYQVMVLGAIIFGYIAQRIVEGIFMRRYGMHIHVWKPIDSRFRLITARRNPNMVILVAALLFARPDLGLQLVALWTLVSLVFHAVRLAMANDRRSHGHPVESWLA